MRASSGIRIVRARPKVRKIDERVVSSNMVAILPSSVASHWFSSFSDAG
jgi:hypothetical protein